MRSQLQRSVHPSQSRVAPDDEDEDFVPIEDVESDSEDSDEDVEDEETEEEEDDDASDHEEGEPVGQNQQQMTSSATASLLRGLSDVAASHRSSPAEFSNANGELTVLLTDPDVLDCPICLEALCTPVFQCENGHIACSSCSSKVNRKCPSCCMPIGYNRCRAVEKIIESVKVPCKNTRYGCTEITLYNKKSEHEQMCAHATCFCPHTSCPFAGSSKNLYQHFVIQHVGSTTRFTYNTTFSVEITTNQKHFFLQEQEESVIFILNQEVREDERAFSIDCVGPHTLKTSFVYELTACDTIGTLCLRCVPDVYTKWSEHVLKRKYVAVPNNDFLCYNGTLSVEVRIERE